MISSAHVNFNFQSPVSDKDHATIQFIQSTIANLIPGVTLSPSNEIHATWGQSTYFADAKADKLQKIDLSSPRIQNDYNNILSHLKSNLSSIQISDIASVPFSKFRITENGFIIAELKSNSNMEKIARSFEFAHYAATIDSHNESPYLSLTKHYQDSNEFGLHITLGKINNLAEKEKYAKNLNNIANDLAFSTNVSFSICEKGTLTAACKKHGQRIHICKDELSLAEEHSLKSNTHTSTSIVMQQPTAPILHSFNNIQQPVSAKTILDLDIKVSDVKEAIAKFFPEAQTKKIGVIYPNSECRYYKITFLFNDDKRDFCKKFSQCPGKKGECKYSDNPNENHVWMDKDAVLTLIQNNKSNKKSRQKY